MHSRSTRTCSAIIVGKRTTWAQACMCSRSRHSHGVQPLRTSRRCVRRCQRDGSAACRRRLRAQRRLDDAKAIHESKTSLLPKRRKRPKRARSACIFPNRAVRATSMVLRPDSPSQRPARRSMPRSIMARQAEHPSEAAMTLRKNPRLIPHVPSRPRVHLRLVGGNTLLRTTCEPILELNIGGYGIDG